MSVKLVRSGEVVKWQRTHMREVTAFSAPGAPSAFADAPPSDHQLRSALLQQQQQQGAPAGPPPPVVRYAWDAPVLVFFDLEVRNYKEHDIMVEKDVVQQISAVAIRRVESRSDDVVNGPNTTDCPALMGTPYNVLCTDVTAQDGGGYHWTNSTKRESWTQRGGVQGLVEFIEAVGEGAPGVVVLAHNGPGFDLGHIQALAYKKGIKLPLCVSEMFDSKDFFLIGIEEQMGNRWSMEHIYKQRFGEAIPGAHTARGDTAAMMRIFGDVCKKNPDELCVMMEARWMM